MHPILGSIRRLAIYLLAWLVIGLLLALGLGRGGDWLTAVAFFVPLGVAYALITQSAWYVCRIFPLIRARGWHVAVSQICAAVFASAVWVAMAGAWARTLSVAGLESAGAAMYQTQRPLLFVVGALLFWLVSIFFYLLIAFDASKEAERANLQLTLLAREAELRALRAQIDPHFIFNSLHSISALTSQMPRPRGACACCWRIFCAKPCDSAATIRFRSRRSWRSLIDSWRSNRSGSASG
jgi:two-component system sensor histidine kinase AlgZ